MGTFYFWPSVWRLALPERAVVSFEIPASRAKRQIVLQRLALEFDVGHHYTEREVNEILFAFHPDWSALRRYLVDEGYLDRGHIDDENRYWRSGGRVVDLPSDESA